MQLLMHPPPPPSNKAAITALARLGCLASDCVTEFSNAWLRFNNVLIKRVS